MIPLMNHDFRWGRSEVVIICPDSINYRIRKPLSHTPAPNPAETPGCCASRSVPTPPGLSPANKTAWTKENCMDRFKTAFTCNIIIVPKAPRTIAKPRFFAKKKSSSFRQKKGFVFAVRKVWAGWGPSPVSEEPPIRGYLQRCLLQFGEDVASLGRRVRAAVTLKKSNINHVANPRSSCASSLHLKRGWSLGLPRTSTPVHVSICRCCGIEVKHSRPWKMLWQHLL